MSEQTTDIVKPSDDVFNSFHDPSFWADMGLSLVQPSPVKEEHNGTIIAASPTSTSRYSEQALNTPLNTPVRLSAEDRPVLTSPLAVARLDNKFDNLIPTTPEMQSVVSLSHSTVPPSLSNRGAAALNCASPQREILQPAMHRGMGVQKEVLGYTFRHVPYDGQTYFQAATETELQKLFLNRCEQIVPGQEMLAKRTDPASPHMFPSNNAFKRLSSDLEILPVQESAVESPISNDVMATAGGLSASDVHILAEFLDLTPPSSSVSTPAPTPTPTPLPVEMGSRCNSVSPDLGCIIRSGTPVGTAKRCVTPAQYMTSNAMVESSTSNLSQTSVANVSSFPNLVTMPDVTELPQTRLTDAFRFRRLPVGPDSSNYVVFDRSSGSKTPRVLQTKNPYVYAASNRSGCVQTIRVRNRQEMFNMLRQCVSPRTHTQPVIKLEPPGVKIEPVTLNDYEHRQLNANGKTLHPAKLNSSQKSAKRVKIVKVINGSLCNGNSSKTSDTNSFSTDALLNKRPVQADKLRISEVFCPLCDLTLDFDMLAQHLRECQHVRRFCYMRKLHSSLIQCPRCHRFFKNSTTLQIHEYHMHLVDHADSKLKECEPSSGVELKTIAEDQLENNVCPICRMVFAAMAGLKKHLDSVHKLTVAQPLSSTLQPQPILTRQIS